ncbi:hypothetical protein CP966_25630 [Streptomyces galilaeus]|uniref:Uncharacterized protein n=1 Tax=Streptomyces bobili TaxID=67280 RepID=A0ABZ1QWC6_9ACTN|nr:MULTISPECIES: hypothetical protein [Streptomyces]QEU68255.1 hypothetical protein CP966_25630 [Streptomyces galilaeus]GGW46827.1 hypothetical protein GCM10010350_33610 [Streptomyces galilaeus]
MSGRTDSDTQDGIRTDAIEAHDTDDDTDTDTGSTDDMPRPDCDDADADGDSGEDEYAGEDARQARWTAAGTGALLTLAGLAAALLRLTGPAPALVPAAYALGAAVCALAALLGSRGRTRRALWLLIAGVMVMAVGDQLD